MVVLQLREEGDRRSGGKGDGRSGGEGDGRSGGVGGGERVKRGRRTRVDQVS